MLKRGLLFSLVFIIFLQSSLAQDSCLVASEENVPIVAQNILQIYSQIYDNKEKAVEAAIDSVNRWQPSGNVDSNWVNFKSNVINTISYFASFNREYSCSEFVEDFTGDTLMQGNRVIRRCNQEGKHCVQTKYGAGCVVLEKSIRKYLDKILFSEEEHDLEAYNALIEIKDLRSIPDLLFFYIEPGENNKLDNLFPLYSAIASTGRQGVNRILEYLPISENPLNILGVLEFFEGNDVVEPLYELFINNEQPNLNIPIAQVLIKFNEHPLIVSNYRRLIDVAPSIRIKDLVPVLLHIPEINLAYQEMIRGGYTEHEAKSIIFVSDRYNKENPETSILEAVGIIKNKRNSFKDKVILNPDTTAIQIFYSERFDSFMSSKNVANNFNGLVNNLENKDRVRELIRASKGPTFIWVGVEGADGDGTGIRNDVGFTLEERKNRSDIFEITYQELGDDLSMRSGSLEDVVIVLGVCYTYNMAENLRDYLKDVRGVRTFPTIITAANKDSEAGFYGTGRTITDLLSTLISVVGADRQILGSHILELDEAFSRGSNDIAIFYSENNDLPLEIAMSSLDQSNCGCTGDSCPIQQISS